MSPETYAAVVVDPTTTWTIELDRLEIDVLRAERALPLGEPLRPEIWHEPALAGPMPAAVVERARDLLARQEACLAEMARALGGAARQHAMTMAVTRATASHGHPVYVDEAV